MNLLINSHNPNKTKKMATNKNATIRYQTLNRCFRNPGRQYYIDDLLDACNEALLDVDPDSSGIKKRQLYDDIKFMQDSKGFDAPIESFKDGRKAYYRYTDINFSINNQPVNEQEAQQLNAFLQTISRFRGMPQFAWLEELTARLQQSFHLKTENQVLSFDENLYLTGREHISNLYNSIINHKALLIKYHPFQHEDGSELEIHPYYLKQYNNRWFLFGLNKNENQITNLALDRILGIEEKKTVYIPNNEIDFDEFFEDVIGVSIPNQGEVVKVILKIEKTQWNYIKTKPMHGSQKIKEETEDFTIIELELIPNFEFESMILSFGEFVEIIAPEELKCKVKDRITRLYKKYSTYAE